MEHIKKPIWILISNTIPQLFVAFVLYNIYDIIHTELNEYQLESWQDLRVLLIIGLVGNILYYIVTIVMKRSLHLVYFVLNLLIYIPLLLVFFLQSGLLFPWSVPRWMYGDWQAFYFLGFLMPTALHSILGMVLCLTPKIDVRQTLLSLLGMLGAPLLFYLLMMLGNPLRDLDPKYYQHIITVIVTLSVLVFAFFLGRVVYLFLNIRDTFFQKYGKILSVIFTILFPVLGLLINNGHFFLGKDKFADDYVFGNFSNPWFYIVAVFTGVLLSLPSHQNRKIRLVQYLGRCLTLSYTLYFFLVFLPYLPFSFFAIFVLGLGFLMMAPTILMLIHSNILLEDVRWLRQHFSPILLYVCGGLAFVLIPILIHIHVASHRRVLHEALDYVYTPDLKTSEYANVKALDKLLDHMVSLRNDRSMMLSNNTIPLYNSYYNWYVFDNLTLSISKIDLLSTVFLGKKKHLKDRPAPRMLRRRSHLEHLKSHTTKLKGYYKTAVELTVVNDAKFAQEFSTDFKLPEGAFVRNHYLWIEGEKVKGILAERKSAEWIYRQITSARQDPSILSYTKDNDLNLKVFPVNTSRRVGFEIIHKVPFELSIDGHKRMLGKVDISLAKPDVLGQMLYVSPSAKEELKRVQRKPYFHFLIDQSAPNKDQKPYDDLIKKLYQQYPSYQSQAKISLVNATVKTFDYKDYDQGDISYSGGFFLDRAFRKALYQEYESGSASYPVFVVISDHFQPIMLDDLSSWKWLMPEGAVFYRAQLDGALTEYKLGKNTNGKTIKKLHKVPTRAYKGYYLPDDGRASLLIKRDFEGIQKIEARKDHPWEDAVALQGQHLFDQLHPSHHERHWLMLLSNAFRLQTLTPYTSFIALESEAQRKALIQKQKDILSGKSYLDLNEEERMSEPALWWGLLFMFLFVLWKKKRRFLLKDQG